MNVISFGVKKPVWQDDHQRSVHNVTRIKGSASENTENVKFENLRRKSKEEREIRTKELFAKLRNFVFSRKYRDVSWNRIVINVGGTKFSVLNGTIRTVSGTRLANLNVKSEEYDAKSKEYFFDRNPELFPCILDFYRNGEMHIPRFICAKKLSTELKFWGLNGSCLSHCCRKYYYDSLDEIFDYEDLQDMFERVPEKLHSVDSESNFGDDDIRYKIWSFLNNPSSSTPAKIWSIVYMTLVILSIICMFTSTLSECRIEPRNTFFQRYVPRHVAEHSHYVVIPPRFTNFSAPCVDHCDTLPTYNNRVLSYLMTQPHPALIGFDVVCLLFFTVEIIVRFVFCRQRWRMLRLFNTMCDILYLIPAWVMFGIDLYDRTYWHDVDRIRGFLWLQTMMSLRVLRLFRFTRHYHGLKTLWLAVRASKRELFLLFVFMIMATAFYATVIFCTEFFEASSYYNNIFIGMWWSLITMTTVGYGDYYPNSTVGYILACLCALTGIILMGMPVPLIARNFHSFYGLQFYHTRERQIHHVKYDKDKEFSKFSLKEKLKVSKPEMKILQKNTKRIKEPIESQNGVELKMPIVNPKREKILQSMEKCYRFLDWPENFKVSATEEDLKTVTQKKRRISL